MTLSRKKQQRDIAILQLLSTLPTHPYDLERQLLAMGQWWSTHGAVNLRLKRLQVDGLVTSAWETPQNSRARLVCSITEAGIAYLQRVGIPR
jgi:DNA-binding PadR family transcriptional regulator